MPVFFCTDDKPDDKRVRKILKSLIEPGQEGFFMFVQIIFVDVRTR